MFFSMGFVPNQTLPLSTLVLNFVGFNYGLRLVSEQRTGLLRLNQATS